MQLNIDAFNIHIHLHKEPALGAALVKAALAEKDQQAEQPAEALAETPECEAKCSVTSIELPQIMCELAGVKFPMPAQEQLNFGKKYFVPAVDDPGYPKESFWTDTEIDKERLEHNLIQSTKEGATQQARAMAAALEQAIGKAKE